MDDDRRSFRRYTVWFPVTLDAETRKVFAIARDASPKGILISATTPLEVGASVMVTFRVAPDDEQERQVVGRVVRIEPADEENPWGVWPHRMAVEFDEAIAGIEVPLEHASERPPPDTRSSFPPERRRSSR
jgi:hypothetical protein